MNLSLQLLLQCICSKLTGEYHPCRVWFQHGCFPIILLHIFKTPFPKNASGGLLLKYEKIRKVKLKVSSLPEKITPNKIDFVWQDYNSERVQFLLYKSRNKTGEENSPPIYPIWTLYKQIRFCYGNQANFNEWIKRCFPFLKN